METTTETMNGTIKSYSDHKGYGWIISKDSKDTFFHISGLADKFFPSTGDRVSYSIIFDKLGRTKATNIKKLGMEIENAEQA